MFFCAFALIYFGLFWGKFYKNTFAIYLFGGNLFMGMYGFYFNDSFYAVLAQLRSDISRWRVMDALCGLVFTGECNVSTLNKKELTAFEYLKKKVVGGVVKSVESVVASGETISVTNGETVGVTSGVATSEAISDRVSGEMSGAISDRVSGKMSGAISDKVDDETSGATSGVISDKVGGEMSRVTSGVVGGVVSGSAESGVASVVSCDEKSNLLGGAEGFVEGLVKVDTAISNNEKYYIYNRGDNESGKCTEGVVSNKKVGGDSFQINKKIVGSGRSGARACVNARNFEAVGLMPKEMTSKFFRAVDFIKNNFGKVFHKQKVFDSNCTKSGKIGQNRAKSVQIGQNRAKIVTHNIYPYKIKIKNITKKLKEKECEEKEKKESSAGKGIIDNKIVLSDIEEFVTKNNLCVDGKAFFYFYKSKGWRVGGNIIIDWQAKCLEWHYRKKADNVESGLVKGKKVLGGESAEKERFLNSTHFTKKKDLYRPSSL